MCPPFTQKNHTLAAEMLQEANIDARIFLKIEKLFQSKILKSSTAEVYGEVLHYFVLFRNSDVMFKVCSLVLPFCCYG